MAPGARLRNECSCWLAAPAGVAALAWGGLAGFAWNDRPDRPPVLALAATVVVWVTFQQAPGAQGRDGGAPHGYA